MDSNGKNTTLSVLKFALGIMVNFVIVLALFEVYSSSYRFGYQLFINLPYVAGSTQEIKITISEGTDATEVSKLLEYSGIVENRYQIRIKMYLGKYEDRILAGTYILSPSMRPQEILDILSGKMAEEE